MTVSFPERIRTPLFSVLATLALMAASAYLGGVFERVARPKERSNSEESQPDGLTRPEVQQFEDRVVERLRSSASARAIDSALRPLRASGMRSALTPEAIIERRAAWWRSRIARTHPTQRALAIARARTIGFSDDELDLLPRTPERESLLLQRILDPTISGAAVAWADALSRTPLTPEAALHAIAQLAAADVARQEAVARALDATHAPIVLNAWWSVAADPGQDAALRALAARNSVREDPDDTQLQRALALFLDGAQPVEVRRALLSVITSWRLADDPRVRQTLRTLAADTAAPLQLRRSAVSSMGSTGRAATAEDRAVVEAIQGSAFEPQVLRSDAADAMARLDRALAWLSSRPPPQGIPAAQGPTPSGPPPP